MWNAQDFRGQRDSTVRAMRSWKSSAISVPWLPRGQKRMTTSTGQELFAVSVQTGEQMHMKCPAQARRALRTWRSRVGLGPGRVSLACGLRGGAFAGFGALRRARVSAEQLAKHARALHLHWQYFTGSGGDSSARLIKMKSSSNCWKLKFVKRCFIAQLQWGEGTHLLCCLASTRSSWATKHLPLFPPSDWVSCLATVGVLTEADKIKEAGRLPKSKTKAGHAFTPAP